MAEGTVKAQRSGPVRPWLAGLRPRGRGWRVVLSVVLVAVLWEVSTRTVFTNPLIIVPLSRVAEKTATLATSGTLWRDIYTSLSEFALGFAIAVLVGVTVGTLMAVSDAVHDFLTLWVSALYATPTVAVAPIFIIWFGIGWESKIAVAALLAVFPIIINTEAGIRACDRHWLEVARSFQASGFQTFRMVLVPASLPFIIAGLRLAVGRALVGVVVAEFFGARSGLGLLILSSSQVFDTAALFMAVIILAGFGAVMVSLLGTLERKLAPWRAHGHD